VRNNAASAFGVSEGTGDVLTGAFIIAWAAVESNFGTSHLAHSNDNFFGEAFCATASPCVLNTNPDAKAPWQGAVPCSQLSGSPNPGFACFTGSTLAGSALAALAARHGLYLNAAKAIAGGTVAQIAQAIANAGWCTVDSGNQKCTNGAYGAAVQAYYNELLPIIQCLYPFLLW